MKKENSLKKAMDFQKVIDTRQSVGCKSFVIYYLKNEFDYARIGISSGKRLGNAVIRNRTKRQVRAIIDSTFNKEQNLDMIVIVRNKFLEQDYETNLKDFKYLLNKINKEK
jgi:ribonuclease P protein component